MTQIAEIEVSRGSAKPASGILLLLGILLFLNYGAARLGDVNMAVFIVFGSAILYVVLMALPFIPGIEIGRMLMAMPGAERGIRTPTARPDVNNQVKNKFPRLPVCELAS